MAHDDSTDSVGDDAIVGPTTPADGSATLFGPSPEAVEAAKAVFETRMHDGEPLRMGQVLRRARELLGIELSTINKATGISNNYLMAIERMETGPIPKGYLVPYLISYAKQLGLPSEQVAADYTHECGAVEDIEGAAPVPKIGSIAPEKSNVGVIAAAAVLALAVTGGAVWLFVGNSSDPEISSNTGIVAVNGARESLFTENVKIDTSEASIPLELKAVRQGWLEVRGADGTIFRSRVLAEGESYFPRLGGGWTVSARDGGAFEWRVGNVMIAPLGPEGTAVFSVSVDDKLALASEMIAPDVADTGDAPANP